MLLLGGVPFVIQPEDRLNPAERAALARLPRLEAGARTRARPFRLQIVDAPPWTGGEAFSPPGPATIHWEEGRLRVRQSHFLAELDPFQAEGRLFRTRTDAYAVEATLRAGMSSRLPLEGGLPLHAAALVLDGQGLVFFGPSGAGKSTIAGLHSGPVLTDEAAAVVRADGFSVTTTGFWGTLGRSTAVLQTCPLRALIELDKGTTFHLMPLDRQETVRRLLGVVMVPAAPPLWTKALGVIDELIRAVPCYRMAWSPAQPPFDALRQYLTEQP